MTKYLLLLSFLFSLRAGAQTNDFEAELRMLEQQEEAAFLRAETVTTKELSSEKNENDDLISDSVSSSASAVRKEEIQPQHSDIVITPPTMKVRRIRSR